MELTVGIWNNKQLSEWFGLTNPKSFTNNKKKKLKELHYFAEFYEEKGKVVITKVLNPIYSKQLGVNLKKVIDKVDETWSDDGLDTCTRVGNKICQLLSKEDANFNLKSTTVVNYTRKGRNELYGKPFTDGGEIGHCIYIWCKRDPNTGDYSFLTDEEQRIKESIQTKYFGNATEKQILVKDMVDSGEITKEEAWEILEELTNMKTGQFKMFLAELQATLGCQVVKGTFVERDRTERNNFLEYNIVDGKLIKEGDFDF